MKEAGAPGRLRERAVSGAEVTVAPKMYSACMDVVDSDHKPVCALLSAVLPVLAPAKARHLAARLIRAVFAASAPPGPALAVSPAALKLHQVGDCSLYWLPPREASNCEALGEILRWLQGWVLSCRLSALDSRPPLSAQGKDAPEGFSCNHWSASTIHHDKPERGVGW